MTRLWTVVEGLNAVDAWAAKWRGVPVLRAGATRRAWRSRAPAGFAPRSCGRPTAATRKHPPDPGRTLREREEGPPRRRPRTPRPAVRNNVRLLLKQSRPELATRPLLASLSVPPGGQRRWATTSGWVNVRGDHGHGSLPWAWASTRDSARRLLL